MDFETMGTMFPLQVILWPTIMAILTVVYLIQFLRFQQGPAYRPASGVPKYFKCESYPTATKDQQLAINVRLENLQRIATTSIIGFQVLAVFIMVTMLMWTSKETCSEVIYAPLTFGAIRSVVLAAAWSYFVLSRRSSRPASHPDQALWLYRLSLRSSAHLRFWYTHASLAFIELSIVAFQYFHSGQPSLSTMIVLGQAMVYYIPLIITTCYQTQYHRRHMVPILDDSLMWLPARTPDWLTQPIFRNFSNIRVLDSADNPATPHQLFGITWDSSKALKQEFEYDKMRNGLAELLYRTFNAINTFQDDDKVEADPDNSVSEPWFFNREVGTYSLLLSHLFLCWTVISGTLFILLVALVRIGLGHIQFEAHRSFQDSVLTQMATIHSYLCYYYLPSQVINNILPGLFTHLETWLSWNIRSEWKRRTYNRIQHLHQQSTKALDYPELFLQEYVNFAVYLHGDVVEMIGHWATNVQINAEFWGAAIHYIIYYPWLGMCAWKFQSGSLSYAECIIAIESYHMIAMKAANIAWMFTLRLRPSDREASLVKILHETPDLQDDAGAPSLELTNGGTIEFRNVSFSYDGPVPVLQGINLTIPAGRTTAIVGMSGHGKSTLFSLIMRMADVTEGEILIDGQDIRRVAQGDLRSHIAYVNHSFVAFPGTIYYNIAYGTVSRGELASKDEVVEAAKAVNLYDTIMGREDGFDAKLNGSGSKMSGGELQRMGIARALVKKSPILLLDEATAALDTATETKIMDYIRNSKKSRTTVIIAHRISTIMDADQIVVLGHGRVAELGTHNELVVKGGIYAEMWAKTQADSLSDMPTVVDKPIGP
ncbi:mitochondrial ABC iron transporter Atm1 [Dimargaris cristalligena]|nr:mitochondrial ABC iron transporter Atm1 [Dimargaris cristalligena]